MTQQVHAWICGKCGARLLAKVGAIVSTFEAHFKTCPKLPNRPTRPPATAAPTTPRVEAKTPANPGS